MRAKVAVAPPNAKALKETSVASASGVEGGSASNGPLIISGGNGTKAASRPVWPDWNMREHYHPEFYAACPARSAR
jgi:hypothetical protein